MGHWLVACIWQLGSTVAATPHGTAVAPSHAQWSWEWHLSHILSAPLTKGTSCVIVAVMLRVGAPAASGGAVLIEILMLEHVQLLRSRTREAVARTGSYSLVLALAQWGLGTNCDRSCCAVFLASSWMFRGAIVMIDAGNSGLRGLFQVTSCLLPLSGMEAILVMREP